MKLHIPGMVNRYSTRRSLVVLFGLVAVLAIFLFRAWKENSDQRRGEIPEGVVQ